MQLMLNCSRVPLSCEVDLILNGCSIAASRANKNSIAADGGCSSDRAAVSYAVTLTFASAAPAIVSVFAEPSNFRTNVTIQAEMAV